MVEAWPGAGRICVPLRRYTTLMLITCVVDTVLTLLLPFAVISLLNVRIAVTVCRHIRARQAMTSVAMPLHRRRYAWTTLDRESPDRLRLRRYIRTDVPRRHSPHGDQFRVTKLLLTISLTFLVLNLPRHAMRAYALAASNDSRPSLAFLVCDKLFNVIYYVIQYMYIILNVIYYSHFAVNIVLYATLSGKKFRLALRRRCRGLCRSVADVMR